MKFLQETPHEAAPRQRLCRLASLLAWTLLPAVASAAVVQTGSVSPNVGTWVTSTSGYVGNSGNGSVTIDAGSLLVCQYSRIGVGTNSTGTVTVTGAGSAWNTGAQYGLRSTVSDLTIGYYGHGALAVEAGGQVTSYLSYVGSGPESTGTATVTGAGSKWTNIGMLYVGPLDNGTLTVADGGEAVAGTLLASLSDLYGNGTITATGAVLDADLVFDAAHGASPSLAFGSGGTLNFANGGRLGAGYKGAGTLTISEGIAASSSLGSLGYLPGSTGTALVTGVGSKWTNSSVLRVGEMGAGVLAIEAGGQVSNTYGYLGENHGSTGTATVTGVGSKWTNAQDLHIGLDGSGALAIEAGGLVSVRGTLTISHSSDFLNMTTGGMLALHGNAADSLNQFLERISGNSAGLRFWDDALAAWAPIASATAGEDYTLEYLASGDLAGYTLLTVGQAGTPGLAGDFNGDGSVDGADFLAWQRGGSPDPHSEGDLNAWKTSFSASASGVGSGFATATNVAVPEPATAVLALLLPLAASHCRTAKKRRRPLAA